MLDTGKYSSGATYIVLEPNLPSPICSGVATASQKLDAASALIGRAPGKSAGSDAIIVVNAGKVVREETPDDDPNLRRIREIPIAYPLSKGPNGLSNGKLS